MQLRVCTFRVRPKRSGKGGLCSGALATMGGGRREGGLAMAPANYSAETYSAPEDCRAGRGAAGRQGVGQAMLRRVSDSAGRNKRPAGSHLPKLRRERIEGRRSGLDRKSTRLNSSHQIISYAVFCLKKKKKNIIKV